MTSNLRIRIALAVSLAALVAASVAATPPDPSERAVECFLEGAWLGTTPDGMTYAASYAPSRGAEGTSLLEWLVTDPTWGGAFPAAVAVSDGHGVWQRCGAARYLYTMVGYAFDSGGDVVYIVKQNGSKELYDRCRVMHVSCTVSLYAAWQDPQGEEPPVYGTYVFDDAATAVRLSVEAP